MPKIKAIIFDLGNVLIRFDYLPVAGTLAAKSRLSREEILDFFFEARPSLDYNDGKLTSIEYYAITKQHLGLDMSFGKFCRLWNSCFFEFPEMEELVYALKQRYNHNFKILLLSNINELNYQYIRKRFKILDAMDELILSYKLKMSKPAAEIYRYAIRLSGANPESILYTDDRPELIAAARNLGINAFVFKNPQDFKKQLSKYGVPI